MPADHCVRAVYVLWGGGVRPPLPCHARPLPFADASPKVVASSAVLSARSAVIRGKRILYPAVCPSEEALENSAPVISLGEQKENTTRHVHGRQRAPLRQRWRPLLEHQRAHSPHRRVLWILHHKLGQVLGGQGEPLWDVGHGGHSPHLPNRRKHTANSNTSRIQAGCSRAIAHAP